MKGFSTKNGPWTIEERERRYKDDFIEVCVDQVIQPNGNPGTYSTVKMKAGVAILPLDSDGNVYLTRQFRYALGRESIAVISGGMEENETPLESAKSEAKEEAGIVADDWIEMGKLDLETSIIDGPVNIYLALGLKFSEQDLDSSEDIKLIKIPLNEAASKVMDSEITHGPSCILILKAYNFLKEI